MSVVNSGHIIFMLPKRRTSSSSCTIYGDIQEVTIFYDSWFCLELIVDKQSIKLPCKLNSIESKEYTAYRLNVSQTSVTLDMPESQRFLENGLSRIWIAVIGNTLLYSL